MKTETDGPLTNTVGDEATLKRLAELSKALGSQRVAYEAASLAGRVAEGRFYVACIGQFKRGKSTVINALLQDSVLPTGVLPITTVPTIVRYGASRRARVRFEGGAWTDIRVEDLTQYVSEENNPENQKHVVAVEVFCPSKLLATGMCFVDTPGLGSVFSGNTEATQAFVPHIDAALVIVGADPPLAGEELRLVETVGKQVGDLIIVLNKADRTSDSDREVAKRFTRVVLDKRLNRPVGPIYEVSSLERLEGHGPERDWLQLESALEQLANESGQNLVRSASYRGIRRMSEELLVIVSEESDALRRPIEESERRISALWQMIAEAEQSLRDMGYLFMAEQRRLSDMFLDQRKKFLVETSPKAVSELQGALKDLPHGYGPRFRRNAFVAAQQVAGRYVLPWLDVEQNLAEVEYKRVALRFVQLGNNFLKKLSDSGVPELSRVPNALDAERGFRVPSRFSFEHLIHVAQPASPLRYSADVVLGLVRSYSAINRAAQEFLLHLLDMNSARVQSDVVNRVEESRGQLEAEIRKLLHEITRIAVGALDHARNIKAEGASAVELELNRFQGVECELRSIRGPSVAL